LAAEGGEEGDAGSVHGDANDARPAKRMRRGDGTESAPKSPLSQEVLPDAAEEESERPSGATSSRSTRSSGLQRHDNSS
jgi:hypothetical protein